MTPQDLVFGEGDWIRLLDGQGSFERVADAGAGRAIYRCGDLSPAEIAEGIASGDFSGFSGRFLVIAHDETRRTLTIWNDRYGHLLLFIARDGDRWLLSLRLRPLLERGLVPRRLDLDALADVLAFHAPMGDRTLVAGVTTMLPATRLTFDLANRTATHLRQWEPQRILAAPGRSYDAAREELLAAFFEGFDALTRDQRVAITLSGGIDSRCLLAVAAHRHVPVTAFNCSVPGGRSAVYAERMAAMTRTDYRTYPVALEFAKTYAGRLEHVIDLTEGMSFASEVEGHWLREHVTGVTRVLHGAFAELSKIAGLHTYYADDLTDRAGRAGLAGVLMQRFHKQFERDLAVFTPSWREELRARARASLEARLAGIDPALGNEAVLQVLYLEEFLAKVTRCSAIVWNDRVSTRFPFGWPRYVDLLLGVSGAERRTHRFQLDLLRRTSPSLYAFPDSNTGLRVDAPRFLKRGVDFMDKVHRVLTVSRTTYDHTDPQYWLSHMEPAPEEILGRPESGALYDRAEIDRLLATVRSNPLAGGGSPVAMAKRRIAQNSASMSIQKPLLLQLFLQKTGLRAD
jgi:asparagine synthase (glutamine-hydrolysing)